MNRVSQLVERGYDRVNRLACSMENPRILTVSEVFSLNSVMLKEKSSDSCLWGSCCHSENRFSFSSLAFSTCLLLSLVSRAFLSSFLQRIN